ncbi:kinase-like domain-containing protein [Xylariomycetidae sp. FL2044]|nr:kinase-like domain-containing protein [Xylariomycetidae sp. FL2044]
MAPLNEGEKAELRTLILHKLSQTPYACSALSPLTNGTTNFVFRGTLTNNNPLDVSSGNSTTPTMKKTAGSVIVKYATDFAAVNRDFPLDASRCTFESIMLQALPLHLPHSSSPTTLLPLPLLPLPQVRVRTPHLLFFDPESRIQVLEYIQGTTDLKSRILLLSPPSPQEQLELDPLSQPTATSIGQVLGSWLRAFHAWTTNYSSSTTTTTTSQQEAVYLRLDRIRGNEHMRDLKYRITYDAFIGVVRKFPSVWAEYGETLEQVRSRAAREFGESPVREEGDGEGVGEGVEDWGIIHGDFWTGNILIPTNNNSNNNNTPSSSSPAEAPDLFVIDWEYAQFGHRAYDLGQMIGDLYERKHFQDADRATDIIDGFIKGYGNLSEEMAFRTAVHAGVHLICWYNRGFPVATRDKTESGMRLGAEFIVKAWERDRVWFEGSPLAGLFRGDRVGG